MRRLFMHARDNDQSFAVREPWNVGYRCTLEMPHGKLCQPEKLHTLAVDVYASVYHMLGPIIATFVMLV
jgi:hypothetical protein